MDYATLKAKLANPWLNIISSKTTFSGVSIPMYSGWAVADHAGAAPSTAAVPTRLTAGALQSPLIYNSGTVLRLASIQANAPRAILWTLCDRLSHQGGLSGTLNGTDSSTNLPTAALTRYTSGDGVLAAAEIYTQVGTSAQTVSFGYTNQAGTGSRTSPAVVFGATQNREANRFIPIPLQSGDKGVRSVESVTTSGSTGTAGNWGVTLYKPLAWFVSSQNGMHEQAFNGVLSMAGGLIPVIEDDACLFWIISGDVSGCGEWNMNLKFVEE
jgi:hypothetical protein